MFQLSVFKKLPYGTPLDNIVIPEREQYRKITDLKYLIIFIVFIIALVSIVNFLTIKFTFQNQKPNESFFILQFKTIQCLKLYFIIYFYFEPTVAQSNWTTVDIAYILAWYDPMDIRLLIWPYLLNSEKVNNGYLDTKGFISKRKTNKFYRLLLEYALLIILIQNGRYSWKWAFS